jgi:predicted secreted protein
MFEDQRSKKVIVVLHCLFNQNARIDECAYFPGAMGEAAQVLTDSGVGILQMPCPELICLGLDRSGRRRGDHEIGIREALLEEDGQKACREMARQIIYQIEEYQKHGFQIIGVIGNDGSPACGVDITHYQDTGEGPGKGAFIAILQEELANRGLSLEFIALRDHEWDQRTARIKELLDSAA